ncbi:MAG TPA: PQQ-dependent sugar dehydrogenase [Gemmatimonadaceae bacterium]|nr:PQQ-dependent sugar dehydrogenase [Gemmatimonadaceae bacterium]
MRHRLLGATVILGMVACRDTSARPAGEAESRGSVQGAATTLQLSRVGSKFNDPVHLAVPPGDSRLFIVEQEGRIRVVKNGTTLEQPFLDISRRVRSGGEQGLLSMAFHPGYRANGYFYVNFTDLQGDTHVERFKVSANPDVADPSSAKLIITVDQPYSNHNGGLVMFGPDGMLYVGMGDGGSGGDPHNNGQNPQALLGKMLRLDVNRGDPYAIPADNPFANGSSGRREIWAVGLRNPWRFSFDKSDGLLYVADVGQSGAEEITVVPANRAGVNYGWKIMEGADCYGSGSCRRQGLQVPALTYGRSGGACSVTGGIVYRGRKIPALAGHYFYSDYCAGWVRSFRYQNGTVTDRREWKTDDIGNVTSFAEDTAGEMYIVAHGGSIFRVDGVR